MARHRLEVADVVRAFGARLETVRGRTVSKAQWRVLSDIVACRTKALGGHVDRCDRCDHREVSYNSCRNRHCPKCQASARRKWLRRREAELLPVPYFHLVFTLPSELRELAMHNPRVLYEILLRSSSRTIRQIAADPKHLGADVGILSILHTWGQTLEYHPHVHCVVTGGGLADEGTRWVTCRDGFFLPVRVLSRLYRGKVLDALRRAHKKGKLQLDGALEPLRCPAAFKALVSPLYRKEWVVYAKAPFGGPEHVLRYLGRYTHRVAVSNQRLVEMDPDRVSFTWKDYAHGCKRRVMSLAGPEFLRRFLMHVLPRGFVRIRHSGFMSNASRSAKLELCRGLLQAPSAREHTAQGGQAEADEVLLSCPACKVGRLHIVYRFEIGQAPPSPTIPSPDTS